AAHQPPRSQNAGRTIHVGTGHHDVSASAQLTRAGEISTLPGHMNHLDVGEYWNRNAEAWTRLARAGHDVLRDQLNTPAFLASLPPVAGLHGLDLGCGE